LSIRIYALAKQLNVDSKVLLDTAKQLGIEGKGSQLASLSAEEVEKVKTAVKKSQKPAKPTPVDETFQRPVLPVDKKIPALGGKAGQEKKTAPPSADAALKVEPKPSAPEPKVESPKAKPVPVPVVVEPPEPVPEPVRPKQPKSKLEPIQPIVLPKPVLPPPIGRIELPKKTPPEQPKKKKKDQKEQKPAPLSSHLNRSERKPLPPRQPIATGLSQPGHAANVRREDYRGPMRGITDKILNLDDNKRPDGVKPVGTSTSKPSGPVIRLAPVPATPQPKLKKKNEPAPQRPTAKLPQELIRAAAATQSKSIEEHIKKHEERQRVKEEERKSKEGKKGGRGGKTSETDKRGRGVAAPSEAGGALFEKDKKRRGSSTTRRHKNEFDEENAVLPRQLRRQRHHGRAVSTAAPRKGDIIIQLPCTVKNFAEQTGLSIAVVMKKLLEMKIPMTLNAQLDHESSELLAEAFELHVTVKDQVSLEDRLVTSLFEEEDSPESLQPRPPIVTVLGHVDHGKTTLLDHILHMNIVSGEKGGITQHIRAYRVKMENGGDITFVDTPGHEAFTEMRARGANCTDIVVLVVAADDGVMPQTEEAISHAKAAGVPIIVALNKMDLPGVNPDRVIQELAAHELMPSEWGGDVEVVRCSGLTGMGIPKLLETIQIVAELHELKANPERAALGVALEAELQSGQGVVAKVLVQNGTLRLGDVVLCGTAYGRVKVMYDTFDEDKMVEEAPPSTPVSLVGLDMAPKAGSKLCVLEDISDARVIAEQRQEEERLNELAEVQSHVTLETLFQRISSAQTVQMLNVIIRADVRGSIEAIKKELGKLEHPEVKIKILQATVGGITEADVQLADASDAIIVGFNVVPDENARQMADRKKIQIRRYDIIYNLTDDIKKALEGMLKPIEQVKELGRAQIQQIFVISRVGTIAGCRIVSGTIERESRIRIIRDSRIIGDYPLDSLKREKDEVKDVREGYECGMKLKGFNDLKEGDILEAYKIEEVARTF
jgi:translation initiation factor IF-2